MNDTPTITIGLGQMTVLGGEPEINLATAERFIADAAARGCTVIVLPECLDLGWTHGSALTLAEPIPGPASERLCDAARRCGIHVVAGLVEREGRRCHNAAVLIDPEGTILLKHRKINELEIAHHLYGLGTRLETAVTGFGVVGIPICADCLPASTVLGHSLARMGAQLLLSPCAWAVPTTWDNAATPYGGTWNASYGELARLYRMTVVGVSNVGRLADGPWAGRPCIGASRAVGPDGALLLECAFGPDAEELRTVTVPVVAPDRRGTGLSEHLKCRVVGQQGKP
ncbi:MAG: carbon-nitrogen hydrolase family protein [Planctomycetes bacterium]|nr:carbon-nitrogen hydrolase family protein [Planctomycetota bacterium]